MLIKHLRKKLTKNNLSTFAPSPMGMERNIYKGYDMDEFLKWEREIYPRNWKLAYDIGKQAKEYGLPRTCNLEGEPFCYGENKILKVYKSAWEQGYDGTSIMSAEFKQAEQHLNKMPLRPMQLEDL